MSALTRCDECGVERSGRRLKYRISMRMHTTPSVPVEDVRVVEKDVCSDLCLIAMGNRRIAERAERKAREASEGAVLTPAPLVVPPTAAVPA